MWNITLIVFFRSYGELKAVRLPKKLVGTEKHRGFGFIEYYTKTDAKVTTYSISICRTYFHK